MHTEDAKKDYQQATLKEIAADIDKLKERAEKLSAQQRVAVDKRLQTMSAKMDRFKEQLSDAKTISADAVSELKEDLSDAWERLKSLENGSDSAKP